MRHINGWFWANSDFNKELSHKDYGQDLDF